MERYRQRTIAELLKKTYKLNRPRMTPILEGKNRMQGPLDTLDSGVDFAEIQVCVICRNHLDASIAQNCGVCMRGYHSFCLEAPHQAAQESNILCCYYCQNQAAPDSRQSGSRQKDSYNKLSDNDEVVIWRSNENMKDCDEPGTSYDASKHSPSDKQRNLLWSETSPSKRSADSGGTIFDTLYLPTKTRGKLCIRRKRIPDTSGQESSCSQASPSGTGTLSTMIESSGLDAVQTDIMTPLVGSGGVMSLCLKDDTEDEYLNGATLIQNKNLSSEMGNGEQLEEGHIVSPEKTSEIAMETGTDDKPIKEGGVTGAEKMTGIQKLDLAITEPASVSVGMPSEDCLTGRLGKNSVMSDAFPLKIQEDLTETVMEWQSSDGTGKVVAKVVSEHDFDGEIQVCLQQQAKSVDGLPTGEHSYRAGEKLTSNTCSDGELFGQSTMEKGARSPIPAIEAAKNNLPCRVFKGLEAEDANVVKGTLSYTLEEIDELPSDGLRKQDERLEELLPSSLKGLMEVDSTFMGPEAAPTISEDSPNIRVATEDVMKVCEICGDAGFEDMIAICSDCNGAEHVYCYESLMAQVPDGYWQCNICKSKQRTSDSRLSTDLRIVNSLPTRMPSVHIIKKQYSTGNARSRLSALLQKRKLPSDKKRTLKGVPSSQFTAKRGLMVDATDAPPAKKQAVESSSSMSNMPSSKFGLLKEVSFKAAPETGKVKFVSPTALMGTNGEVSVLSSRGSGKLSHLAGSSSSGLIYPSTCQSGQASKGRLSSASSSIAGTGNKVNTTSQLNNLSSSVPLAPSGSKSPAALKSSDSLPSVLLYSKSLNSKLQLISKGTRDASDSFSPSLLKEGVSGQAGTSNTRTLVKASSFKLSKGIATFEPKLKNDSGSDSAKPPGPKILDPEAGVVKAADSKHEDSLTGGLVDTACEVEASMELCLHSEIQVGVHNTNKLSKQDPGGSLELIRQSTKDEVTVALSGRSETQISPAFSSSVKDAQVLSIEQDTTMATPLLSPSSMVRQISTISEPDTSKEVPKISRDTIESAPLLPLPVVGVQESLIGKTEEKRPLQLAVNLDTSGENNVVDKSPTKDDAKSTFTPRSRSFGAWGAPSYVPSLGSTRCYRCKELGHSAKNCNSRSFMPCLPSDGVVALKPVPPFSSVDTTGWLKGMPNTDSATRNSQSAVEISPRIKPVLEMTSVTKPPCTEGVLVSVQGLCSTAGEAQLQTQEGQIVDYVVPLVSSSLSLHDQAMRKETMDPKQLPAAKSIQCPTQVNVGGADDPVNTTEIKIENDVITLLRAANSTAVHVPSGPLLTRSAPECQPPLLPIPVALKSVAHFSASLGQSSSATLKATNPLVSRYQDSMKVYPESQIVWQGTFEVSGRAKTQATFHGLQANPSNRALPKVREVARKLQPLLPLEELPRGSEHNSWPVQFQKSPPINDNIALYFFASGKESYVQYYKPLVDRLIKFDLTLKGFIEDAELLIFPSNLLPPGSQCWNNFMFLWAVFRARKLPVRQPILHMAASEPKPVGTEGSLKLPSQSGALPWGKVLDMQINTSGNKSIDTVQVPGNKAETPGPTIVEGVNGVGTFTLSDSELVVCQETTPSQQEVQHLMEAVVAGKERFDQKAQIEHISSGQEKLAETVLPSAQSTISVAKSQPLSHASFPEGALIMNAGNELPQPPDFDVKADEKVDTTTKPVVSSAVRVSSVLLKTEHGSSEKAKHSTPVIAIPPASLASPSPRDRQEDLWTPRKLSSDKEKGVRERVHDKSDRIESGRGVSRDRDRDKQRDREKQKERDRDRERSRRHSDYEREKERERVKERDRDKDRDRERDRDRDRDRDRGRDRERDRERWRDREDRDRRGRDWDSRDRVSERDKVRERGRERESERERVLARERSSRHRHWDPDGEYGRTGRHWHRHPRSRTPSRSPPGNRDWSPSRARLDRYHHRYRRSSRHSRSYSHSPDSDHGMGRLQPRAESRDLSKDSFVQKGKSPDIIATKEESVVKNSAPKDYGGEDQGNFSQRGSNSNSLCRETTAGAGRKLPIADLNLSPSEIEGCEADGLEDGVIMSVEVAKPLTANQDSLISNCHEYFLPNGVPSRASREPGECSISAGKVISYRSTEHLGLLDERTDSLSHSLINDSSGPSLFPVSMSIEGSSSCLQFFPQAPEEFPSTPDLNLALSGAKEQSPPTQGELPFIMQLLEPSHHGSPRAGTFSSSFDVPIASEQADLSLSLAIPEHSKRPIVNTSLRLFG